MARTFYDIRSREMIRSKLSWYRFEHQTGLPTLKSRIEGYLPVGDELPLKTFYRFMKGIWVDNHFVAQIDVFSQLLPDPPVPSIEVLFNAQNVGDLQLRIEVAVNDRGQAIVFHNKPFPAKLAWFEYDVNNRSLNLVFEQGTLNKSFGIALKPELAKYFKRAKKAFVVLMDDNRGEPVEGGYFPVQRYRYAPER